MERMRLLRYVFVLSVLGGWLVSVGCQSVATTSAKLRNEEGNYEIAIRLAKQALQQNPNDAEAYYQLGVSYSNLDSVALAYEYFTKSKELNPKNEKRANDGIRHNFAKHFNLGQKAFQVDIRRAAKEFELATQADPREPLGYYNLGVAYTRLAQEDSTYYPRALAAFDKVLELSKPTEKRYVDALRSAGRVLAAMGQVEAAMSRFQRLVDEDPASFEMIEALGMEQLNKKDWRGAAIFLELAAQARAKVDQENFNTYYNLAASYYNLRREEPEALSKAVKYYKKALDLEPDEPQTIFNVVACYVAMKDWANAITWGERYVALKPDDEKGWMLLSRAYSEAGEQEKAKHTATKYEELMKMKGKMQ
jgi:tetratricopeptide (TPR) repeat protein